MKREKTDIELVELAKQNPDNFEGLVSRYEDALFRFIKRISYFNNEDIEDILQEVFIKVYRNLNAYDDSLKFSSWIYQITRNHTIDMIRKSKARPQNQQLEEFELVKIFKSTINVENETVLKDDFKRVKETMDELPLKYREVLILRFLEEKDYEEIMDILKKPKGTVATLIRRGRELLEKEARKKNLTYFE